jgi:hypothetical protein
MGARSGLRRSLDRLQLLRSAWRLHGVAQGLARDEPLAETRAALLSQGSLPRGAEAEDALWAARWVASARRRLFGQLDTCLVRSLVAGALVADGPDVAVRVGVHRPEGTEAVADLLDAHAWLTVTGREISLGAEPAGVTFEEVLVLPMERA